MVEVFKTDVCERRKAAQLKRILSYKYQLDKISFDLEDKDKILRVESFCNKIESLRIIEIIKKNGQYCEILNH